MTKPERIKCEELLSEAIKNIKIADKEFEKAAACRDRIEKSILLSQAYNHRGYAEGINQVLATVGFKHEQMKELGKLID